MDKRTQQQNKAIHKYCANLAQALNLAGLDMKQVLKPHIEIPWSPATVKDFLWRPIQRIQFQKESTTELTTKEVSDVWETVNRHLSERFNMTVPFPSIEEAMLQDLETKPIE